MTETGQHEVMDIREAAQFLRISPDTLYKYAKEGYLPAFKDGQPLAVSASGAAAMARPEQCRRRRMMPVRIQRKRTKGWRLPEGAEIANG